jgi:outer membrane protein assembly factor BamB
MTNGSHHHLRRGLAAAAAVPLLLAAAVRADDWPQWRGPNRDGVWRETFVRGAVKVRWRAPVGPGWSSPVVAGGRVYLTDSRLSRPRAEERVLCFDEATGKPLWAYAYAVSYPDWAFTPGQEAGPCATPAVAAGKVYSLGGNGNVHCLDARTGRLLWQRRLDKDYQVAVLSCRASPLIDGKLLVLFTGGKPGACVVALDKESGKEVWKALDESVSNSSPLVITAGGRRQLVVWTGESVTSLDPGTGKVYWRLPLVTSNNDAVATPVWDGDLLLVGGLMLRLDGSKPAASVLWPKSRAASRRILSNTSTAALLDGHVYSARSSGELVCLEAKTGKQVWATDKVTDLKGGASIHLTRQGDGFFLYTDRGELIRADLSPRGYHEVGRAALLQPVYPFAGRRVAWSPPAYADGRAFARSEKELVCASLAAP